MVKRLLRPRLRKSDKIKDPSSDGVPRITNDTIAETRAEVLRGAKKFIYPLQHSKHRVVLLSTVIGLLTLIIFFSYCMLSLYKFKSTSTFIYRVTQVIPFPAAKAGGEFVSYEEYLFEIRQYIHYFETQEDVDFSTEQSRPTLEAQRKEALAQVVNKAYIRHLAKGKGITVSTEEVDKEIELLQSQNRLGSDQAALKDVIRDYYGWTTSDFRRSLTDKILAVKVLNALDTATNAKAQAALSELKAGADFAATAAKYTDDPKTKTTGGEIPFLIARDDRNVPSELTSALYALEPGKFSEIFSVGYGLEIAKNLENKDGKIRAAYILFNYQDIQSFINAEKENNPTTLYLHL